MHLLYEEKREKLYITHKMSKHFPPHLHEALEMIYVTEGNLELGIGEEMYHMEKGDFAIVFPNLIHHYQVFSSEISKAYYLFPLLSLCGSFREELQKYCPADPVIHKEKVHPDILYAIRNLYKEEMVNEILQQSFVQIILARSIDCYHLMERRVTESTDVIYQTVCYIAQHFREQITLDQMSRDLGIGKYVLSRVFSSTFHKNFNQYVNEQRLNYVCSLLEESDSSITDIYLDAGFQSQRTFNRAFQDTYKMTPREYRNYFNKKRRSEI